MKVYFPDLSHRLWYWVIGQKYFNLIFFWNHKNSTSICILHWRFEGHRTHEKNRNYLSNWKNLASQLSLSLNVIKNAERKKCLKRHILKHHSMSSVLFSCFFLPFCWFDSLFFLCVAWNQLWWQFVFYLFCLNPWTGTQSIIMIVHTTHRNEWKYQKIRKKNRLSHQSEKNIPSDMAPHISPTQQTCELCFFFSLIRLFCSVLKEDKNEEIVYQWMSLYSIEWLMHKSGWYWFRFHL